MAEGKRNFGTHNMGQRADFYWRERILLIKNVRI
jgi:hypothetical protein